jgi:hypothetical protein
MALDRMVGRKGLPTCSSISDPEPHRVLDSMLTSMDTS